MVRILSVIVVLFAVNCWGVAPGELVSDGGFGNSAGWNLLVQPPWVGYSAYTYYDGPPYDFAHIWYAQSGFSQGQNLQAAYEDISLRAGIHYILTGDLKAWTDDTPGIWATSQVRLALEDSSLGAGWQYYPTDISYTATTSRDINNWHTISAEFDLAPGFNVGTRQLITLWARTDGNYLQAAVRWDNISLVPEPATLALFGLGGLTLLRRKRSA